MSVWRNSTEITQRRLWMWCVYMCLCVLSFVSSCELTINPSKTIYLRLGNYLNLTCTSDCNLPPEDLQFTIGTLKLQSRIIDNKTIQLYNTRPDVGRKVYYCSSKTKKIPTLSLVYVEPLPGNVTDFKCIVDNFRSIDCNWSPPNDDTPINYKLTYTMDGAVSKPCDIKQDSSKFYCHLDSSTRPSFKSLLKTYDFHLKAENEFGVNEQSFSVDIYSIVNPKPVYNLIATNISPHAVELNWKVEYVLISHTFPYIDLTYRIEYQIPTLNDSYRNVREVTMLTENNNITYYLDQLPYAHMKYKLQIFIKIAHENNTFWSKPCELEFETADEKPPRPPELPPGAFDHSNYQGTTGRIVYAYWKQLEKYEESGVNFTYHFYIKSSANSTQLLSESNLLENRGYLKLESKSEDPIDLTIWSKNKEGLSVNSSNLHIPAYEDTVDLRVSSFTAHAYENGTYALFWKNSNNVDNYTLFWCTQHSSKVCKEGIEYETIDSRNNRYSKTLPKNAKYQFALSANMGVKSSGMVWPKPECEISQDTIAMSDIKITLKYLNMNKKSIKLFWVLDCIYDGIITGYNISYYLENNIGSPSWRKFVYISDPNQWYVIINDLRPFTRYHFEINLDTDFGLKRKGHNISLVTLEDTPSPPRNFRIYAIQNESLMISIQPPQSLNGKISHIKYVIYNNGKEIRRVPAREVNPNHYEKIALDGLNSFTNYSLSVKAHNDHIIDAYSDPTDSLFVRTRIGKPSRPVHPSYKNGVVSWKPPEYPGGYVDRYLVKIITEKGEEMEQHFNGTVLEYYVTLCKSETQDSVSFQVRAENIDSDQHHGALAFSDRVTLPVRDEYESNVFTGDYSSDIINCFEKDNLLQLLSIIFAGFLSLFIIYGSLKLYRKYKDMANIDKPELPLGIRLSEQRMVVKTDNILISMDLNIRNKEISSDVKTRKEEENKDSLLTKNETDKDLCKKSNDDMQLKDEQSINRMKETITSCQVVNANEYKQPLSSPDTENGNTLPNQKTGNIDLFMPASNGYVSSINVMNKHPHAVIKPVTISAEASGYVQAMPSISTSGYFSNGTIKQPHPSDYVHHSVFNINRPDSDNRSIILRDDDDHESYEPDITTPSSRIRKADLLKPALNDYVSSDNVMNKLISILDSEHPSKVDDSPSKDYIQFSLQM